MGKTILVIGATGNVGRHITPQLAELGFTARAATRDRAAYQTTHANEEVVRFDYDDPMTHDPAIDRVDRIFMMVPSGDASSFERIKPFIQHLQGSGVQHVVLMSAMGADEHEDAPLRKIEQLLMETGPAFTILRPNWFMQNFYPGFIYEMIQETGAMYLPAGEGAVSFIDTRDIADVAVAALTDDHHAVREYTLTGPEALTHAQAASLISEAAGRDVSYHAVSDDDMHGLLTERGMSDEAASMMVGLFQPIRDGHAAALSDDVEDITGKPPRSFQHFVDEHGPRWQP